MRILFLLFCVFTVLLISCSDDETTRRDSRDREPPRGDRSHHIDDEEQPPDKPQVPSQPKDLVFPLDLTHHKELHISGQDNSYIQLSVEPKEKPLRLIAGWSGRVSIQEENGTTTITLKSSRHNKSIHYMLNSDSSWLQVSDGQSVSQKDVLAQTTHPLIFSISRQGHPTPICLSVTNLSSKVKVVKNIPSSGC